MATLSVQTGETVQVIGKRSTVAKALPAYAEDRGQGIVQMDGILRENTQAGLGERVQIRRSSVPSPAASSSSPWARVAPAATCAT